MIAWPVSDLLPHAGAAILIDEGCLSTKNA